MLLAGDARCVRGRVANPNPLVGPSAADDKAGRHDWYNMQSSGGAKGTDMLTHVRAVLSILKFRGHPDLQSTVVSKAQNYWLKITGAWQAW